jgi:hypothetical protein
MTIEELVTAFLDSVVGQCVAISNGDAGESNRYADATIAAFDALRSHGDLGRAGLAVLLTDERGDVRVAAAAYLLRYCEPQALAVLEAEAKGRGMLGFKAAQALKRWKSGEWNLDPE